MKANEYQCYICKNIYGKGITEEEALIQLKEEFGPNAKPEDCELVCDDCFNKEIKPTFN